LKLQIFKSGIHQNHLARQLGLTDTVLSKIIHGYRQPTPEQRILLAEFLRADESWLFEKYDVTSGANGPGVETAVKGKDSGTS
jgi:transcriptional regulator with XRE-family HTH domain